MFRNEDKVLFPFFLFAAQFSPLEVTSAELLQWLYNSDKFVYQNTPDCDNLIDWSTPGDDRIPQPGRGYLFDGVDDFVPITANLGTDIGTGDYTLTMWVRPDDLAGSWEGMIGFGTFAPAFYARNVTNNVVTYYRGGSFEFVASMSAGSYYHLAFVRSSGTLYLYFDGVLDANSHASVESIPNNFALGSQRDTISSLPYQGLMYDVRIYNSAKTQPEVANIMAGGIDTTNLIYHGKCDEGDLTKHYDSSGSGYDGVITGATLSTFHAELTNGKGSDFQNQLGFTEGINYLKYSGDLSQASVWANTANYTYVAASTAPVGVATAQKVTQDVLSATYQAITAPSDRLLYSIYYKDPNPNGQPEIANFGFLIRNQTTATNLVQIQLNRSSSYNPVFVAGGGTGGYTVDALDANGWRRIHLWIDSGFSAGQTLWIYVGFTGAVTNPAGASIELAGVMVEDISDTKQTLASSYQATTALSLGGSYIPRDESVTTLDVLGETLEFTGRVPYDGELVNSNCATFDGVDDYVDTGVAFPSSGTIECYFKYDSIPAAFNIIFGARNVATEDLFFGTDASNNFYLEIGDKNITYPVLTADTVWRKVKIVYGGGNVSWQIAKINEAYPEADTDTYTDVLPTQNIFVGALNTTGSPGSYANARVSKFSVSSTVEYAFAEGAGTTIYDVSGNANHGTATNITPANFWANTQDDFHYNICNGFDVVGNFDGSNDYIESPNTTLGDYPSGNFSVAFWLFSNSNTATGRVFSKADVSGGTQGWEILLGLGGTSLTLRTYNGATNAASWTISPDTWAHYVVQIDGGNAKLFINGVQEASAPAIPNPPAWSGAFRIGIRSDTGTIPATMHLQQFALYPSVLSPGDITTLATGVAVAGADVSYLLTEAEGTTILDSSGNGYDGTLNGATAAEFWTKVPSDTLLTGKTSASNPAVNGHNNAETQIDRNPEGAPQLVNAGVPLNDTISFGDIFTTIDPPYDYKRENPNFEQDYLVYDSEPSLEDLLSLGDWLGAALVVFIVDEFGNSLIDEFGDPLVSVL